MTMVGALVLPPIKVGMIEASATRNPCKPCTHSCSSTTGQGIAAHFAGADRVIDGLGPTLDEFPQLVVALHRRARKQFLATIAVESRSRQNVAASFYSGQQRFQIVRMTQVIRLE